jgi:hypothetical protein
LPENHHERKRKPSPQENKKKSKKNVVGRDVGIAVGQCQKAEEGFPDSANDELGTFALPETRLGLRLNTHEVMVHDARYLEIIPSKSFLTMFGTANHALKKVLGSFSTWAQRYVPSGLQRQGI